MATTDVTGPNAAYVAQLLADFLASPASVPDEWRRVFEAADDRAAADGSLAPPDENGGAVATAQETTPEIAQPVARPSADGQVDRTLLAAVAAAMALVKAYRMHGHLAA